MLQDFNLSSSISSAASPPSGPSELAKPISDRTVTEQTTARNEFANPIFNQVNLPNPYQKLMNAPKPYFEQKIKELV